MKVKQGKSVLVSFKGVAIDTTCINVGWLDRKNNLMQF